MKVGFNYNIQKANLKKMLAKFKLQPKNYKEDKHIYADNYLSQ